MFLIRLAWQSLLNRRLLAGLCIASLALSVALMLTVERLRVEARSSFSKALSGTDLVVGARSSPVQLLLHTVFGVGSPTQGVSQDAFARWTSGPQVKWAIPLALGDSHRGFRVVASDARLFEHYRYGNGQALTFAQGHGFTPHADPHTSVHEEASAEPAGVVLGARAAAELGYPLGHSLLLGHGGGEVSLMQHSAHPFEVVGILAPTGTAIDRSLFVHLEDFAAVHHAPGTPEARLSAFLLGLEPRSAALRLQYAISNDAEEALTAAMPAVALQSLWQMLGNVERALALTSACVMLAGLIGLASMLLASLEARRREMAILRAIGARPWMVWSLLLIEAVFIGLLAAFSGLLLSQLAAALAAPWLVSHGVYLESGLPGAGQWLLLAAVVVASALSALPPAAGAYRRALADGLNLRQ